MALNDREVMRLIMDIEMRRVFLDPHTPLPRDGVVQYDASDGWSLGVRMRDGKWDRLDWARSPGGGTLYWAGMGPKLQGLTPTTETQRVQFGIRAAED